jgi:MFS family permease
MLGVFISGLIHVPMGFMADRLNKQVMVVIGGIIIGCAVFSFEWAGDFNDLLLASIFFGLGGGTSMPAIMAMAVITGNRTDAMGSVMALLTMAHSSGMLTGSFLAGLMMDIFQLRLAFALGAILMAIGVGLFIVCTYPKKKPTVYQS